MKRSEIDWVREPFGSRLGAFSFQLSREIIKDMLPEASGSETPVTIDRFALSKPTGGRCYLLASVVEAAVTVVGERTAMGTGIDAYEGVAHVWDEYHPHVTVGSFRANDVRGTTLRLPKQLYKEFAQQALTVLPAA